MPPVLHPQTYGVTRSFTYKENYKILLRFDSFSDTLRSIKNIYIIVGALIAISPSKHTVGHCDPVHILIVYHFITEPVGLKNF